MNKNWELARVLDLKKWQQLQDSLAEALGLAIITVDYKGVPITKHSGCSDFCSHMRASESFNQYCQKCDSRGGFEAVRTETPYIYLCHSRIVDIAIPITVDNRYMGAIMAGQIKLIEEDAPVELEQILQSPPKEPFNTPELKAMRDMLRSMTYSQIKVKANLLSTLCNYIVEEAVSKNLILDFCSHSAKGTTQELSQTQNYNTDTIQGIRKNLGQVVLNTYIHSDHTKPASCKNKLLLPVFQYIAQNKGEMVSQKQAAELCHISAGHFSRIFMKETGDNFSNYYARQKVEWAKELLNNTDLPITQISDELGFSEPGYFIKIFKKYEGITPSTYRKLPE